MLDLPLRGPMANKDSRKLQVPTAVDLFAGAGGLSEGLRKAGYQVLGAVESDRLACQAYRENQPTTHLWEEDIRRLTGPKLMLQLGLKRGQLDLLAACPPCQGFSTMRTRNGKRRNRDPQNALIFEVLRLTRSIQPKSLMIENVPRLAASVHFSSVRRNLERLGYNVAFRILNVADYAVPQKRRRLVLLASRIGAPEFAPKARVKLTVKSAIWGLPTPSQSKDKLHNYLVRRAPKILRRIKKIPRDGGSRSSLRKRDQLPCHKKILGFRDVYGRMAWNRPSPTITGGCINPSKGRFLHPTADRAITLREAAILQTFPKRYWFPIDDGGRYAVALLIGNALPPEFIRRHAMQLQKLSE